jgi:hypothetical protein
MAQRTVVLLIDDMTGEESTDVTNVAFSYAGSDYEIDLNDENYEKFTQALAPFVAKARRIKRSRKPSTSASPQSRSSSPDSAKIREWAKENGYDVSERGRVPQEIREAYAKAH